MTSNLMTGTTAIDAICLRDLGARWGKCPRGGIPKEEAIQALIDLRADLGAFEHSTVWTDDTVESAALQIIGRMAVTGSLEPARFIPEPSRDTLRAQVSLAIRELEVPGVAPRRLRQVPSGLRGRSLGLAPLVLHVLPG